jgi:hypothetical protein
VALVFARLDDGAVSAPPQGDDTVAPEPGLPMQEPSVKISMRVWPVQGWASRSAVVADVIGVMSFMFVPFGI